VLGRVAWWVVGTAVEVTLGALLLGVAAFAVLAAVGFALHVALLGSRRVPEGRVSYQRRAA